MANVCVSIDKLTGIIIVVCCGTIQAVIVLLKSENEGSCDTIPNSTTELEEVKVSLKFWNLFKLFKSSLILIAIYLFYCGVVFDMEINHTFNYHETANRFVTIPFIYALIHSLLERTRKKVKNLNLLSIGILTLQITCSIIEVLLRSYTSASIVSFIFFILNLVFFQKLIFINFTVQLLMIFEIKNIRIGNYISGELNSPYQPNSVLCQLCVSFACYCYKERKCV